MSNELCVVVGAGPGIGLAVARRFAREGFKVALVARRKEALESYCEEIKQAGGEAYAFSADAGDEQSLKAAFDQIKAQLGQPTALIYNTYSSVPGSPSQLDPESMLNDFKVNVLGALLSAQAVIPGMREQKKGTILFTGGGLALNPHPQYASLAAGKAAMRNLAYSLGAELEPEGIQAATVTVAGFVKPGTHFDPDLIAESFWQLHSQPSGQREIVYK
ncbi:MAG TPA: SDR family NAD(P)-dependent oxidoreductase [Chloroflexia bacterium]|nr:SDR family NAD(P)-dependent oxidoreductase [Chloroflexia bacterium]